MEVFKRRFVCPWFDGPCGLWENLRQFSRSYAEGGEAASIASELHKVFQICGHPQQLSRIEDDDDQDVAGDIS
jgi:hypothetical protein